MIVVDASALLEILLQTPIAEAVLERLLPFGRGLHAPHLIDVEIAQVLRRVAHRNEISADHGAAALTILTSMPIHRYPHGPLLTRVWALRNNVTAYDGLYVALAEALDAPLLTRDRRLANAVGTLVRVDLI